VTYRLTASDLREAERAARRFQGAWYGTSGNLAAWVVLLLNERKQRESEIEAALAERMPGYTLTPAEPAEEATFDDPEPVSAMPPEQLEAAWAGVRERQRQLQENLRNPQTATPVERREVPTGRVEVMQRLYAADVERNQQQQQLRPGSREFLAVLDELRDLHLRKTMDYGVDEDALSNIRSSADVCNMPAWAGCVLRMMDKMHRLKAYFRRGRIEFDGIEDTLKDIACYSAIALVLYREQACTKVQ